MNFLKKFWIILFIFLYLLQFSYAKEEAYKLTMKDKLLVNDISTKINKISDKKWDIITSKYVTTINKTIKKVEKDSRIYQILTWIKTSIVNHKNDKYKKENNVEEIKNEELKEGNYKSTTNFSVLKIDMNKVREAWLWFYNSVRKDMWRTLYSYDTKLNDTAEEWSDSSMSRWLVSHKRDTNDSYYNYNKINSWFKNRWVVCKNVNRITHSENIWRWYYKCTDSNDCTDKLITWIKEVFDMYMAEKYKTSQTHYQSIINKEFNKIWLWISIKNLWNKYEFYITTHYCTELVN